MLALAEESVRLVHAFKKASASAHHAGHLQNLEGEKVLLRQYVRKVEHAIHGVLAGQNAPLVLAAEEPLASMFRSLDTHPRLADEMIEGNPALVTDAELEDAATPILDHLYDARERKAVIAVYDELKPHRATTDILYAAHAATGAIDQLLVDLDAVGPGPRQRHRRQRHLFSFGQRSR